VAENLVGVRGYFVVVVRWVCLVVCGGFWLLVVQISTVVLLFRFPVVLFSIPRQQLVFFGAKQQFGKVKNIIFKCGKIIKKYIYIE
jgi:hypothetical protein